MNTEKPTKATPPNISAPNGIAIGGGVVTNPTVNNNYGPPPPPTPTVTVCFSQIAPSSGGIYRTTVTLKTDVEVMEPWYVLIFDGPLLDGNVHMTTPRIAEEHGQANDSKPENTLLLKIKSIDFGPPRWLPDNVMRVTTQSMEPVKIVKLVGGSGEDVREEKFVYRCE